MNVNSENEKVSAKKAGLNGPIPEWVHVRLTAYMNVYAHALASLLTLDSKRVTGHWLEMCDGNGSRTVPSTLEQIEELAEHLAENSDDVAYGYFGTCDMSP
jgi:hypothetical protein